MQQLPAGPLRWVEEHCPSLDGQFLFLDPQWWNTHLLSEGAVIVLREAAAAIEAGRFAAFCDEIREAGGWSPELAQLVETLTVLAPGTRAHPRHP